MSTKSVGQMVVRGFLKILVFWLFWKFGGFLVGVLVARTYGTGPILDAYTEVYKNIIYLFLFSSFLKVVVPAFMPTFIDELSEKDETEAWEFAASIVNLVMIVAIITAVGGMIYSAQVIDCLVPGFEGAAGGHASLLLRWMLPGAVGLIFSVLTLGILNSYKIFGYPAASDAAQKLVWAAVLFICIRYIKDARAIAIGFSAGCVAQVVVCMLGLGRRLRFFRPSIPAVPPKRMLKEILIFLPFAVVFLLTWAYAPSIWAEGDEARMGALTVSLCLACGYVGLLWVRARRISTTMARFVSLAAPLAIGVVFARYRDLATFLFQSYTQQGVFGAMEYAKTVAFLPIVLVAYALSVALFPYLCETAAKRANGEFGRLITQALKMVVLFFGPLAVAMIILDEQIIQLIYDKGNWPQEHIEIAGLTLSIFMLGLVFMAIENVSMQSFFSMKMTWQPTVVGIAMTFLHVGFLYVFISVLERDHPSEVFLYTALALPLSRAVKNVILIMWMRWRVRVLPFAETFMFLVKLGVAMGVMALAMTVTERIANDALAVNDYKSREVMLDTFNREPNGWLSRDAVAEVDEEGGGVFLRLDYKLSGRREIAVERKLKMLKTIGVQEVSLRVRSERTGAVSVEMVEPSGSVHRCQRPIGTAETWIDLRIQWDEFDPPLRADDGMELLRIVDTSSVPPEPVETWLDIDDLQLRIGGEPAIVDTFEDVGPNWESPERLNVVVVDEEKEPPELSLSIGQNEVAIKLGTYDLSGMLFFNFKAASREPTGIDIALTADGEPFRAQVDLEQSEARKAYRVPVSDFRNEAGEAPDAAGIERLTVAARNDGVLLDNIAFTEPRSRLKFELIKFLRAFLPAIAGLIAFIAAVLPLKIEEVKSILNWLREEGLAKVRMKFGGGGGQSEGTS